ncbi:MAG TPA: sigma-70 family RNA polymerase sigma factor [Gammaproteobacteria bacterium]|nr:sigma-70 family RNA polymerase sigma factor [Gammaproteobacteria bacterium]
MTDPLPPNDGRHQLLVRTLTELRPRLHRYAARMTGSAVDGDDVVQEVLVKALESPPEIDSFSLLERWLIRVTHNAAIDFLRQRKRQASVLAAEELEMIMDPDASVDAGDVALVSLRTFMRLPALQRSTVIFKDVLGYSLDEVAEFTGSTVPAVKSALQRGRARLQELGREPDDAPLPTLDERERRLLAGYAERFNARDFDAVRAMLADEVKLNLVNRLQQDGKMPVSNYFSNYGLAKSWAFGFGLVDRRPALLAFDPDDVAGRPLYFILLGWARDQVVSIRDYRYARYAMEGAEIRVLHRPR